MQTLSDITCGVTLNMFTCSVNYRQLMNAKKYLL